jgi:hypothetical protein
MRRLELEAIAAGIPTATNPDGTPARAYVGGPHWVGGRQIAGPPSFDDWQVYFGVDGGRRREYVGPVFTTLRARDGSRNGAAAVNAMRLAEILNRRAGA